MNGTGMMRAHSPIAAAILVMVLAGCRTDRVDAVRGASGEPMIRTELFFGLGRPDGAEVTDEQWQTFVRDVVTPRFPEGLTVVSAAGQWQDGDVIHREPSRVLILLRPAKPDGSDERIEQIRSLFKERFNQSSVLRSDAPVRASF